MRTHPALRHAVKLLGSLLLVGGLVQSCSKPDTILLVNVDADPSVTGVTQLKVRVLIGQAVSQFFAPMNPGAPISFPTSFTVEVARSNSGPVNVTVTAMGSDGKTAMGTTNLPALDVGNENVISVHLGVAATMPDGGVDSGPGNDGGVDAPTDRGTDGPHDTGPGEVSTDVGGGDTGGDAIDMSSSMGGSGMGGSGMGGSGMGGSGMGGSGMGGSGMGGAGMGGSGMGGSGMGGAGMGGDMGMGGDLGTAGDAGTDASDAGDTSDADLDAPTDV